MTEPRTVLWDIETTHNLAAVFKLTQNDYIQAESQNCVDENVGELHADGLVNQCGSHGRVHAARKTEDDLFLSNLLLDS